MPKVWRNSFFSSTNIKWPTPSGFCASRLPFAVRVCGRSWRLAEANEAAPQVARMSHRRAALQVHGLLFLDAAGGTGKSYEGQGYGPGRVNAVAEERRSVRRVAVGVLARAWRALSSCCRGGAADDDDDGGGDDDDDGDGHRPRRLYPILAAFAVTDYRHGWQETAARPVLGCVAPVRRCRYSYPRASLGFPAANVPSSLAAPAVTPITCRRSARSRSRRSRSSSCRGAHVRERSNNLCRRQLSYSALRRPPSHTTGRAPSAPPSS